MQPPAVTPIISKFFCRARSASSLVLLRRELALRTAKTNSAVIGLQLVWRAGHGLPRGRAKGRAVGLSPHRGIVWLILFPLSLCSLSVPDERLPVSVVPSEGGRQGDFSAEPLLRRFPCTPRHGPSDAVGSGWPRVRGWSGLATDVGGFGECYGEIGAGLSVGRGGRLTSVESCRWAVVNFAGFILEA